MEYLAETILVAALAQVFGAAREPADWLLPSLLICAFWAVWL
jgi:hypothetical protein